MTSIPRPHIDQTLNRLRLDLRLHGPASRDMERLREAIARIDGLFVNSRFKGTLLALSRELVTNGFKAVQKQYFLDHLRRQQPDQAELPEWREEFRNAIDEGLIDEYMPADPDAVFVDVRLRMDRRYFTLEVRNPGAATAEELARIHHVLENHESQWQGDSQNTSTASPQSAVTLNLEANPVSGEGAGLGLRMILMTLEGMGIDRRNLQIHSAPDAKRDSASGSQSAYQIDGPQTIAILRFPLGILYRGGLKEQPQVPCAVLSEQEAQQAVASVHAKTALSVLIFDTSGRLLGVTPEFLQRHATKSTKSDPGRLAEYLPGTFFEDFFVGPNAVREDHPIQNYRIPVPLIGSDNGKSARDSASTPDAMLYHVNACRMADGRVYTLWQEIVSGENVQSLGHGFFEDSMHTARLISPYIPPAVLDRAREVTRSGGERLPDEVAERAIFFSDLVGFTRMTSELAPAEALSLLNIAMDICVRTIRKNNGMIDKFLGDGILAIYHEPIDGVISAFEIQFQFEQLNEFRKLQSQPPLNIRTGIHSGQVVFGSVGNRDRKDWTVIGDVVNTAARIQSFATAGEVVVSKATLESMRDRVRVSKQNRVQLKGKAEPLDLVTIERVYYQKGNLPVEMSQTGLRLLLPGEARQRLGAAARSGEGSADD